MEPLANKAILDEALRFQGTLSWTQSSWGEGPSSSSTPFLGIGGENVFLSWEGKCQKFWLVL